MLYLARTHARTLTYTHAHPHKHTDINTHAYTKARNLRKLRCDEFSEKHRSLRAGKRTRRRRPPAAPSGALADKQPRWRRRQNRAKTHIVQIHAHCMNAAEQRQTENNEKEKRPGSSLLLKNSVVIVSSRTAGQLLTRTPRTPARFDVDAFAESPYAPIHPRALSRLIRITAATTAAGSAVVNATGTPRRAKAQLAVVKSANASSPVGGPSKHTFKRHAGGVLTRAHCSREAPRILSTGLCVFRVLTPACLASASSIFALFFFLSFSWRC